MRKYKTLIFPVIPFGCETWSLTLREEHRLRVFEIRMLRRIFGPKRYEVTGDLRRLHNEELHNVYSSPNIIRVIKSRKMRWAGHVARMGRRMHIEFLLVGKPEGKRQLGRPRHGSVGSIKMDRREKRWDGMDLIVSAQDRDQWRALVITVMNLRVP
jgi:hypothetical protein